MPVTATDLTGVLHEFRAYRESLYSEPTADPAWVDRDLHYELSIGSTVSDQIMLQASRFDGDGIDRYSFDPAPPAADGQAAATVIEQPLVGWPGGIAPPGSHGTERDGLPSLRSSHRSPANSRVQAQWANSLGSRPMTPSHHALNLL